MYLIDSITMDSWDDNLFDQEETNKNLALAEYVLNFAKNNHLECVLTGSIALGIHANKFYRTIYDVDVVIKKQEFTKWREFLKEWRMDPWIKVTPLLLSNFEKNLVPELNYITIKNYIPRISEVELNKKNGKINFKEYYNQDIPRIDESYKDILHNPKEKDLILIDNKLSLFATLNGGRWKKRLRVILYYTDDGSSPSGINGTAFGNTQIEDFKLEYDGEDEYGNKISRWKIENFSLNRINILKYKIGVYEYSRTFGFSKDDHKIGLFYDEISLKHPLYKTINGVEIKYSDPKVIFFQKYDRPKDIKDLEYYKHLNLLT